MLAASNVTEYELVTEITEEFRNTVLPVTVFFGVEMMAGIPGNLLTVYVFLWNYKPCNFRYFVLSLAFTDLVSCLTTIPGEMVSQIFWYSYPAPAVCKTKVFFNRYTLCSEAATITIIAIDRYRKVCRPLRWQIQRKYAICACVVIHGMSAILSIPTPIFWGVHSKEIEYKGRNITVTLCEKDETYNHTSFALINVVFNGIILSVSLLLMFVLYVQVAWTLVFSPYSRKTGNENNMENTSGIACSSTGLSTDGISNNVPSIALNHVNDNASQHREESETSINDQNVRITRGDPTTRGRAKKSNMARTKRKTLICFCLTVIFITTTVLYNALISVVATGILARLHGPTKAVFFFFLRLYFINRVINPVLYGLLDSRFRTAMRSLKAKVTCC